jgi:UDP-N-acetylglucosamine/UDP-N-acetylgalactosamine diphosphorylase
MAQYAPNAETLRRRAEEAGQEHVFRFWDELSEERRERLLRGVAEVDFEELSRLVEELVQGEPTAEVPEDIEPAPFIPLPTTDEERRRRDEMRRLGEDLIAAGRVGALTVAGGQGTRLGYDGPKGAFPIGPVSGRPLFQIFAEGILAARRAYGAPIPWYIMTSRANDQATRDFFEAHGYFDLPRSDVRFFVQGMMPAVDFEGRLILAAEDRLFWSPDGHGGTVRALERTGTLEDMRSRGVAHISYFQVDNPLVPPVDPVFIGYHAAADSEMSSKMVRKRGPEEKLGHFCISDGKLVVVEYSDMPKKLMEEPTDDGRLRFEAGSIAIHVIARSFVERLTDGERIGLPFHRADKKIAYVDEKGNHHEPEEASGIKFEMFIFDALPLAENPVVLEIDRAEEFSPVKNAEGDDSPATARRDMVRRAARRLREAGVEVPRDDGEPTVQVEINPLLARNADELAGWVESEGLKQVTEDLYLGPT